MPPCNFTLAQKEPKWLRPLAVWKHSVGWTSFRNDWNSRDFCEQWSSGRNIKVFNWSLWHTRVFWNVFGRIWGKVEMSSLGPLKCCSSWVHLAVSKMRHQVLSFCISPLNGRLAEGPNRTGSCQVGCGQVSQDPVGEQNEPLPTGNRSWWFERPVVHPLKAEWLCSRVQEEIIDHPSSARSFLWLRV